MKLPLSTLVCLAGAMALGCQASASARLNAKLAAQAQAEAQPEPEPEPEPVEEQEPLPAAPEVHDPDDVHIEGDHLVIDRHINFATNSDEILEDSFDLLDHIAQLLKNHPEITTVHVIGHTDSAGSAQHNLQLSDRRANSVVEALRSRNVSQSLDAAGKGKSEPLCRENTDECHQRNRRVEFLIEKSEASSSDSG